MMSTAWLAGPERSLTRFAEKPRYREGLYRVSADCYAWLVPNGAWGETNIGLIDCGRESVLIDTCWDLHYTTEMLDFMHPVVAHAPITHIINTHADGDHCWGNQLFGNTRIISSQACARHIHHTSPTAMNAIKNIAGIARHLPLRSMRDFGHYMGAMLKPYDFSGINVQAATETFVQEKQLRIGNIELQLIQVGPAHTDGDTIIYIPERNTAYSGDIVFADSTPVAWAGPVENIVQALRHLLALKVDILVPGHGPLATPAIVQQQIDYWEFLQENLYQSCQQGIAPQDAARQLLLSARFGNSPFANWGSPERAVTSAFTLYRHWGIKLPGLPDKLNILNVLRHQAGTAMRLPHASPAAMHSWD
ncbi:MAG: MBL fold metallo-hydrolase [Parahaliea sp.]